MTPSLSATFAGYYPFKYAGIVSRLQFLTYSNTVIGIGGYLRGIRDSQDTLLDTTTALIFNFDVPIKIVQTDWRGWGKAIFKTEMPSWFRFFDFEFQFSPFVDAALSQFDAAEFKAGRARTFDPRDGWYAAGLDALVFPNEFRSIQVRASLGVDAVRVAERFLPSVANKLFNTDWRKASMYEIFIGIGLHY
jgi:hypothetical protein